MRAALFIGMLACAQVTGAAQFAVIGDLEVHYIVVNTLFIQPNTAERYGIVRGRDRVIVNVSVIGPDGRPRDARVEGSARNLLEQTLRLEFKRIADGDAIYFIAPLRHTDQDVLRFRLAVDDGAGSSGEIEFQERLWVQPE